MAALKRGEAYSLLLQSMNQLRNSPTLNKDAQVGVSVSENVAGESGTSYLIEVSADPHPDGGVLIRGKASSSNPHDFQMFEESLVVQD